MTTSQHTLFERPAPPPTEATYHAWTIDTKEEVAATDFARRYGQHPEFVFESLGLLLCGPIPAQEA